MAPVIPTLSYGAVLGGVTSPVVLGLHSDWTTLARWLWWCRHHRVVLRRRARLSIAAKDSLFRTLAVAAPRLMH